jgi:hypothetical protein
MYDVYQSDFATPPSLEDVIAAAMRWHFGETTGSPFWLAQAKRFSFDPRRDIKTRDDLALFPDVGDAWEAATLDELLPQGCIPPLDSGKPWAFAS